MAGSCIGCDISILNFIRSYLGNEKEILNFLERHGLLTLRTQCGKCNRALKITKKQNTYKFRCEYHVNNELNLF